MTAFVLQGHILLLSYYNNSQLKIKSAAVAVLSLRLRLSLISHLHETCLCWARAACSKPCCSHLRPSTPCCVRKGPDGPRSAGPDPTRASAGFACSCRTSRTQTRTADRPPEPAEGPASSLYRPDRASKTQTQIVRRASAVYAYPFLQ